MRTVCSRNKFEALATCDALVQAHGALKGLAVSLMKIADDAAGWPLARAAELVKSQSGK
ncbi:lyase family protein [Escherichia coli]